MEAVDDALHRLVQGVGSTPMQSPVDQSTGRGQMGFAPPEDAPAVVHTGAAPSGTYVTKPTNSKAIGSMVLALVGLGFLPIIPSIFAISLARTAKVEIELSRGEQTGESIAQVGLILGWIGVVFYGLLLAGFIALVMIGLSVS